MKGLIESVQIAIGSPHKIPLFVAAAPAAAAVRRRCRLLLLRRRRRSRQPTWCEVGSLVSLPAVKAAGASCRGGGGGEGGGTALVKSATHLKEEEKQRMSPRERDSII